MKKTEAAYEFCVDALELAIFTACTFALLAIGGLGVLMFCELLNR
jgi:hypothetical protein